MVYPRYACGPKRSVPHLAEDRFIPHIEIREIVFPPAQKKTFSYADEPVAVYSGHFIVRATLAIQQNAAVETYDIKGSFASQACSETSCLPRRPSPFTLRYRWCHRVNR
ncbi:MAG: protein-disulfide reductase DsbD family protein [Deltaproteobacteria bacterium]|nr:protein-disulfide reductase DsbD family protein [Deltaproteobacteria bacterium]